MSTNTIVQSYKKEIEKKLSFFQDPNFKFNEALHEYRYDGIKFDSVTTFLKNFKEPFDRDFWLKKKSREIGVDPSVLESEWKNKADVANSLGTNVHKWIEDFWSGLNPDIPDSADPEYPRIMKFKRVHDLRFKNLIPLKSELRIFSKKWKLAGTIDQPFLMWDENRKKVIFLIGDWKTNREFKHDSHPKGRFKKMLRPFHDLWENQHNEYSVQVSLYRLILEDELGLETESGFLCHIGPDEDAKIYPAKDLRERLRFYLDQNRTDFDIFNLS